MLAWWLGYWNEFELVTVAQSGEQLVRQLVDDADNAGPVSELQQAIHQREVEKARSQLGQNGVGIAETRYREIVLGNLEFVVTTDPHSYNTIRNEYPDFGGAFEIQHYTSFVKQLFASGKLKVTQPLKMRATFHDPCHLGRFNKGYEAPREVLKLLGCEIVEMGRNRANSFCCGAGGGRIWMPDPVGMEKPAQNRIKEAAVIEGLDVYVVSCPKDLTMFEDALKTTGNEGKFAVKELIELIREAIPLHRAEEAYA